MAFIGVMILALVVLISVFASVFWAFVMPLLSGAPSAKKELVLGLAMTGLSVALVSYVVAGGLTFERSNFGISFPTLGLITIGSSVIWAPLFVYVWRSRARDRDNDHGS